MEGMGEDINLIPILEYIFWLNFILLWDLYEQFHCYTNPPPPPPKKKPNLSSKINMQNVKTWLTDWKRFFFGGGGGERFSSYLIKFL